SKTSQTSARGRRIKTAQKEGERESVTRLRHSKIAAIPKPAFDRVIMSARTNDLKVDIDFLVGSITPRSAPFGGWNMVIRCDLLLKTSRSHFIKYVSFAAQL
ncbi:MAG: hypothetical protein M1377_03870, partial [Deltaproteobacteria bacterium]|nr:hypothetical protein [Deltaproteobacteria bacterium]